MHIFSYNKKFHKIQNSLQASVPFIESLWDFTQKKERWGGQLSRMIRFNLTKRRGPLQLS